MNVRFGLACLVLVISCWCCATSTVSAVSNGVRPRRQSRRATLNEYLTPPAPPNAHALRGTGPLRNPRNHPHPGVLKSSPGPGPSTTFRHGKILIPPAPPNSYSQGYFARLMGWLNPFGGGTPPQRPPPPSQHRPDNTHQGTNFNSGHSQPPPRHNSYNSPASSYGQPPLSYGPPSSSYGSPASSYGPPAASYESPASSYGSPTNSYKAYAPGQSLPRPPSPQGGHAYHPPQQTKNCNPCNQVPWVPLYNGVNTVNSRYASGSVDLKPPESLEASINQNQNSGQTNIYQVPSFSHEVKTPDFGYGIPSALPVGDPNHQPFSSSSGQLNTQQNNQNFNIPQTEYTSPFTGPIPNPHLYPGAMPPLFKAIPFDPQPQATDTSFAPSPIPQLNHQTSSSFGGGNSDSGHLGSASGDLSFPPIHDQDHYNPSSNLGSQLPASQNHRYSQQQFQNGESPFIPSIDHQRNQLSQSGITVDPEYVDELPSGAETASGPGDNFPPSFPEDHRPNDNGASNSDLTEILHGSTQHEATSDTTSIAFETPISEQNGQMDFQVNRNSGNGNQAATYGTHLSSDGQHIIHYEQSPVIDLSSEGINEKGKESNDSSAASSTATDAVEDPPVILQNPDGTYGINTTSYDDDSSKILWPDDDGIDINIPPVTASSPPNEFSNESGQHVRFEDVQSSPSSVDTSGGFSSEVAQEGRPGFTGYIDQVPQNNSDTPSSKNSKNKDQTIQKNYDSLESGDAQGSVQDGKGSSGSVKTPRQENQQFSPYPGVISYDDGGSFGFRLPEPPSEYTTEEPFLQALMKSYDKFKKSEEWNEGEGGRGPGSGRTRFDSQLIHSGEGFQPSRVDPINFGDLDSEPTNRQQGAKRNKQVQIIIPYTSQYTPKPFHPSPEDWSTKTTPSRTQARKVPIYDKHQNYLAQETRRVENEVSQILLSLENSSMTKGVVRSPTEVKANNSIDVLRLQKNIDNWTIQEYSRGTTISTATPKSSRPYLSPSKQIPDEYLTTTEPVVPATNSIEDTRRKISNVLAGFNFNDLEHEGSASEHVDVSHVEVSPRLNVVSSVLPEKVKSTTATSIATSTTERDSWKQLPVSISPLNKERVYVVTPQTVPTVSTVRNKSEDKSVGNDTTRNPKKEKNLIQFETIERAYQVLPQAVNNLAVASTGPAIIPLWGIMEHEEYASTLNKSTTSTNPILYVGHSKVSHTRQ